MSKDLFPVYRVTNAHWKFEDEENSTEMGCMGQIKVVPEIKKIAFKCEGVETKSITKVESMKVNFEGHINKKVYDRIVGKNEEGLKPGVMSYGTNSRTQEGTLTFDAYDLTETDHKLLAFPRIKSVTGYTLEVKNGETEVAEVQMEFEVYKDEYEQFLYEAFASKAGDLTAKWHKNFESKDMQLIV